jgi:hypothetical protein
MKKKYKEFAKKFEALCEEYANEDFDIDEVVGVCREVAQNFAE